MKTKIVTLLAIQLLISGLVLLKAVLHDEPKANRATIKSSVLIDMQKPSLSADKRPALDCLQP